ncbi:hypothetical protein [Nonomuraea sp. NPDC050643]|uniref:hypothetical protein n=1 Tax=Nonomuraea sp. NPDC050643 TaxID=3155660 RepID=UPI0033E6F34A
MAARRVLTFPGSRFLLMALMAGCLVLAMVSHEVPLPRGLDPLLAFFPLLVAVVSLIRGALIDWGATEPAPRVRDRSVLWRSVPLWLLFAATAGAVWMTVSYGNVPRLCTNGGTSCVKVSTYGYSSADGVYARRYPFDQQGVSEPDRPWVTISEEAYVAEVGTILRQSLSFGALCLFFAFVTGEAIRLGLWRRRKRDLW